MNISDISKVERKGSNLCVLFTRRNKDNHFDECSIKYSQAPQPDFERAWKNVLDELVAMVPEWEPVSFGLDQISRTLKKKEWIYSAKMSIWPHDEVLSYDRELILKNITPTIGLCDAIDDLWREVGAYIQGKRAQQVLQFGGVRVVDEEAAKEAR